MVVGLGLADGGCVVRRPDKLLDVATASLPTLLRAGGGAFVLGYQVKFVEEDQGASSCVTACLLPGSMAH